MGNCTRLNEKQNQALKFMQAGMNVHLYGEAGTGKSFVLKEFIKSLSCDEIQKTIIAAPTGIAAINVGGATLHRIFHIPITLLTPNQSVKVAPAVKAAKRIIIDEYSMMRFDVFDYVARSIFTAEEKKKKKIQLIVVGDALQLPPVIRNDDNEVLKRVWSKTISNFGSGFPFVHPFWEKFQFVNCHLTEVVRQRTDFEYIQNENLARVGNTSCLQWFMQNTNHKIDVDALHLCPTNQLALAINNEKCEKFKNKIPFCAVINGKINESDKPTDDLIELASGMRVMAVINEQGGFNYQNGSLGTVVSVDAQSKYAIVKFDNGQTCKVYPYKWEICNYEVSEDNMSVKKVVIGTFEQIPLKIAYAITIHKSQGQTYDKVTIHPNCFAAGQLYVALSRCKTRSGIYIDGILKPHFLMTAIDAVQFYNELE
ncbi:MAG: AAA family ATPase [Phascolarctobacterium sp.]|nr:AAA family ATPase [Candidatus Phascolarctobacterium caballi]